MDLVGSIVGAQWCHMGSAGSPRHTGYPVGQHWWAGGQSSRGLRAALPAFLTSHLSSQASGDTPTTPKHPKDSRENFFPVTVAPTAPDPVPADSAQRPSDAHTKPRPALAAATTVITCPPSASASTLDPSKDPGPPRPHRHEATPSMASLGPGESHPSPELGPHHCHHQVPPAWRV